MRTALRLAFVLALVPAVAQAQMDDHSGGAPPGRGDVHSKGWADSMKLKGGALEPRFPQVGKGIERHVLPNGLVVYLAENHELPLIDLELTFRGGSYYEGAGDWGLAAITGGQMKDGGTEALAPDALDDRLAFLAASVSTFIGDESGSATLNVLKKNFDDALPLFADIVLKPRFDDGRLQIAKRRQIFGLMHQNDNPGEILGREMARLLYGPDHPRGRQMTPEMVQAFTRDRMIAAHRLYVRPDRAFLAAVGDFDSKDMLAKLTAAFSSWEKGAELPPRAPNATMTPHPGVYLVDRPVNQSNIAVAHLGVTRDEPDRYAIDLMNTVLGGGSFSSRITERVRSDEGLAYSAGSRYTTTDRDVGTFAATVQTKTETTAKAIGLLLDEIGKIRKDGSLSKNEFETALESRMYSQVFRFESLSGNVSRLMRNEMDGRPADQDHRDFDGWKAVTPAAVEAAAKKHLRPQDLTIFVVGDAKQVAEPLKAFGEVHVVPLTEFAAPEGGR